MDLGIKIKNLREIEKISQEQLAKTLKINRNYLSRIETGKSDPSLAVLRNIASYFKVDITTLMDIQSNGSNSKEKIDKIIEGCQYLLDSDLDFLIRAKKNQDDDYLDEYRLHFLDQKILNAHVIDHLYNFHILLGSLYHALDHQNDNHIKQHEYTIQFHHK